MFQVLDWINHLVWGIPALLLILGVGMYISVCTGFVQFRLFPRAVSNFLSRVRKHKGEDGDSSYRALCTALAATVGTGNVAGVAGAIAIGGPGAIFWMWVCALLGMVTKFAEAALAVRYCSRNVNGEMIGGPMYMIENGMPKRWKWLAVIYCYFGVVAAFGVGNATQVNAVIGSVNGVIAYFGGSGNRECNLLFGVLLSLLILSLLLGGAKRIGSVAERLVPFAALGYVALCVTALLICRNAIPGAVLSILHGAFAPKAVTGGLIGTAFTALRVGASRGVFTNEAGMGTAAIAHGTSEVSHPAEQGLMGIMEVFLDTILICTLTALVILCSGVGIEYGVDVGVLLTVDAFSTVFGSWICVPIAITMCLFAIATVIGWGLYGIRCAQYLFGDNAWRHFVYLQGAVVVISAVLETDTVWSLAETVNGLMAIPNLIALAYLTPELKRLTQEFINCSKLIRKGNLTKAPQR